MGPTLTLISTENGHKFGGYTESLWFTPDIGYEGEFGNNTNSFLFNLNMHKKYYIGFNGEHAIYCHKLLGPSFGNTDLHIVNNCLTEQSSCFLETYSFAFEKTEICGGENQFIAKEVEVFLVKKKSK